MATQEAKAYRRAVALNELDRLSGLLANEFKLENIPNLRPTHRDPDLQRIMRIEAINELLTQFLESAGVETKVSADAASKPAETETEKTPDIKHMKKAELLKLARTRNLDVDDSFNKAEIIEALNG